MARANHKIVKQYCHFSLENILQMRAAGTMMMLETAEGSTTTDGTGFPTFTFFIQDHLGNSRVLYSNQFRECTTDSALFVLEHVLDYYPYGKTLREFFYVRERYQTTHHERDMETGLDYRGARFYDGDIARFLSLDPLASISPYTYVANNPLIFIDPDGRTIVPAPNTESGKYYKQIYDNASEATRTKLDELQNSEITYYINVPEEYSGTGGETVYNFDEERVELRISPERDHTVGLLADELTHASQFENGKIAFVKKQNGESGTVFYDLEDEIESKMAAIETLDKQGLKLTDDQLKKYGGTASFGELYYSNNGDLNQALTQG